MSRIGKKPVVVPAGVKVQVSGSSVKVEGPKGTLSLEVHPLLTVKQDGDRIICARLRNDRQCRALHGLFRALIQNMVTGVEQGFEKKLEIVGVGYNAVQEAGVLCLTVGYANTVKLRIPQEVTVALRDPTHLAISGPDKQQVGQFAAEIRSVRKPEPYKGTGIRYAGEYIRRKAGKAFGSAG